MTTTDTPTTRQLAARKAWATRRNRAAKTGRPVSCTAEGLRLKKAEKLAAAWDLSVDTAERWLKNLAGWMPYDDRGLQGGRYLYCLRTAPKVQAAWVDVMTCKVVSDRKMLGLAAEAKNAA